MKYRSFVAIILIISLLLSSAPLSVAESEDRTQAQDYVSIPDYTKVRWVAKSGSRETALNGEPNQIERLEVDTFPGATWRLSAEFVRVRDGRLLPYEGELDVTAYCRWASDELTQTGDAVVMPEAEGTYTLTGLFTDDEGNLYTCDFAFNVSEANRPDSSNRSIRLQPKSATTVEEKVQQLVEECRAKGFTTEYEIALWLHDWLIYNANYDYTYKNHEADGVLLYGTGVCDSYSKAFQLLLNAFNIENYRVISNEMDHAWNMAKLDGVWCHIDCTWDDPGTGGSENHTYFGMSADLMGRDHVWPGGYPAATSLDNYYPIRVGLPVYSTDSELEAILSTQAGNQASPVMIVYTGLDPDHNAVEALQAWVGSNYWKYGLLNYSYHVFSQFHCSITIEYTDPWEVPENHLEPPVDAPDFTLNSPVGQYSLKNYGGNGILLIFGRTTCGNTQALLSRLSDRLPSIYASGVDVLVSMTNTEEPEDLEGIEAAYPGFHYAMNSENLMWYYLWAAGYPRGQTVTFPCVFVINRHARITYYSTAYVSDIAPLMNEINAVATYNPLPEPDKHPDIGQMLNGTGNVNDIFNGESIVTAVQSAAANRNVILLISSDLQASRLKYFENHYNMFDRLGIVLITSCASITAEEKAAHPLCTFVDYSENDFWSLQYFTGYESGTPVNFLLSVFIREGGEIAAYAKGETLNPGNCALLVARQLDFDATAPASLSIIDDEAFNGASFRRLDLSNGSLTEIHAGAFSNCNQLEMVRIPESVTVIEDGAFDENGPFIICTVGTAGYRYARAHGFDYICE